MSEPIRDKTRLGWHQARKYYPWLVREDRDGVGQVIELAILETPSDDMRCLSLSINRALYRLARDLGYAQVHAPALRWEKRG